MDRVKEIRQTLIAVLVLNWLVAVAKILIGYAIRSSSMTADGFHSFSDGASNIIGLVGIRVASKPKDKEHLYGHKKYETFTSLGIAMLLILACFNIIHASIERFHQPITPDVNVFAFSVMFFTMAVNLLVMTYEYSRGRRLNSDILISDSMHTRSDLFASCSVIISLVAVRLGYPIVDTFGSVLIAILIAYSAAAILLESSRVLCDMAVIPTVEIEKIVKDIEGVVGCHKIRTRGRKDDIHIDLHVLVKSNMHIDKAHNLSNSIEGRLKKQFPGITDIVVHLEPLVNLKNK